MSAAERALEVRNTTHNKTHIYMCMRNYSRAFAQLRLCYECVFPNGGYNYAFIQWFPHAASVAASNVSVCV